MPYAVLIEKGSSSYGAYVPDLPGCVAVGESIDEIRQLIQEALEFHLESLYEDGSYISKTISMSDGKLITHPIFGLTYYDGSSPGEAHKAPV
jgi:predicted RNase H-like HicB family nuclease